MELSSVKLGTVRSALDSEHSEAPDWGTKMIVGTVSIALTLVLLTWVIQKRAALQKLRLPPGPRGWPVVGSLLQLNGRPQRVYQRLSRKYGPLIFMRMGSLPVLVACNADMAKEIYKTNDQIMASRPVFKLYSCLFYDLKDVAFAPSGNHWRHARKICTMKLFTKSRISHFQDKRQREVHTMVQSILKESHKGNTVQMDHFFANFTLNVITQIMWNKSHSDYSVSANGHKNEFADLVVELFEVLGEINFADIFPTFGPLLMKLNPRLTNRAAAVHLKMDKFLGDVLNEHKQRRSSLTVAEKTVNDADDFVDVLLESSMESEAEGGLSEDSIKAILTDMILAGVDTSAITLEWALTELLRKPETMGKMQDELSSVVGSDRLVNEGDIPKLTYLNACLRETLRLHPPGPLGLPHFSTAECKINGFDVPAGCMVLVNLWAIHTDPAVWERPLEFDPERFLDEHGGAAIDWKGQDFQLIPFGSGRRMCPGINLASSILHLTLAQLVHSISWSLPGNQKPEDLDMEESLPARKAVPLTLFANPRLSYGVIFPGLS